MGSSVPLVLYPSGLLNPAGTYVGGGELKYCLMHLSAIPNGDYISVTLPARNVFLNCGLIPS
jgi:hypothetical protein